MRIKEGFNVRRWAVVASGIAGEFNGHFANGHVLGGFAASKQ